MLCPPWRSLVCAIHGTRDTRNFLCRRTGVRYFTYRHRDSCSIPVIGCRTEISLKHDDVCSRTFAGLLAGLAVADLRSLCRCRSSLQIGQNDHRPSDERLFQLP